MGKLNGQAYLDYWRTRIARGPEEVSFDGRDAEIQGEKIWEFMEPYIKALRVDSILDFGCGYGRMMRRLRALWPSAELYGVDLCQEALTSIRQNWRDSEPPKLSTSIPAALSVDLIFDCMALQHITDDISFENAVMDFYRLRPGGVLVLFENISSPKADHVRDMSMSDYLELWPDLTWAATLVLRLNGQAHALLVGVSR
jgi:trans-aconitate methyltransferase